MTFTSRSPFAAPGEKRRGLWRALAEVLGGGLLILPVLLVEPDLGGSLSVEAQFLLGAAVLALLSVRRRYPITALLGAAAVLGLLPPAGLPVAVIAYTTAKGLASHRHRTAVLPASALLTTLVCAVFAPRCGYGSHAFGFALGGVLAATTLIVPALVGTANGQQSRLLRALRERAVAAEEVRRLTDSESRIHERSRIAAEMHDLVGHRLSLVSLHTGGLEMALQKQSPELRSEAALVRQAAGDAMRELREVLGVLGPLGRDTGTGALTDTTGTRSDIEALAEESRRGGVRIALVWDGPDLKDRPAQVRRAVHRVVRESLTNVHRYAAGTDVTVTVTHTEDRVELLVRNGPPPVSSGAPTGLGTGRGLVGLGERVSLLGGALEAGPTFEGGFAVTARLPARPDPETPHAGPAAPPDGPPSEPDPDRPAGGVHRGAVGALTGLLGLTGVGVLMMLGLVLVSQARTDPEDYGVPEEPRIGMSRQEMEDIMYWDYPLARAAATGREPARPKSVTHCVYPAMPDADFIPLGGKAAPKESDSAAEPGEDPDSAAEPDEEGPGHMKITRYCFRDDKLTAIDSFTVPVVSRTPPWESP
ncbi:sensor histidine kinase [Streptomyces sp. NPDC020141]|uniref:sensor histidine kinase n=1 Tax=Streptomyces sp. NPDC020141 TaxID=3365065 RepID=UPI003792F9CE